MSTLFPPTLLDSTTNMVLFDDQRRIKKYNSPEEILEDFYAMRLALYTKRKTYLADQLNEVRVFFFRAYDCANLLKLKQLGLLALLFLSFLLIIVQYLWKLDTRAPCTFIFFFHAYDCVYLTKLNTGSVHL